MAASPIRRFTLLDAMVLLAATAVGLTMAVDYGETSLEENILFRYGTGEDDRPYFPVRPWGGWTIAKLLYCSPRAAQILPPFLVAWSAALLVLRMVRPRPEVRGLFTQPGVTACVVSLAASAIGITARVLKNYYRCVMTAWGEIDSPFYMLDCAFPIVASYAAFGVVVTWGILGAGRRLDAEPTWIDRFGRAIGVLWVVVVLGDVAIDMEDLFWPMSLDEPEGAVGGFSQEQGFRS
jgi:hypothetical protein